MRGVIAGWLSDFSILSSAVFDMGTSHTKGLKMTMTTRMYYNIAVTLQ